MRINFIGDIYLSNCVKVNNNLDFENLILNLEAPFTDKGIPAKNKINLFMPSRYLFDTFSGINICAVNLANNHIMDYGEEAFNYTIEVLKEKNIKYFGAGNEKDKFNNPLILEDKVAIFGYSCKSTNGVFGSTESQGSALFDLEKVIEEIKRFKVDYFIIVCLHWGQEYFSFPHPSDVQKARKLIDAGVDLIIGHHPHKIQSREIYIGKHIYYSLGNGIFHDGIVPSKFDGEKFQKRYSMEYKKSNRVSFRVILDTDSESVNDSFMYYDKDKVKSKNSLWLKFKTGIILEGFIYKVYSFYKMKRLILDYHLKKGLE